MFRRADCPAVSSGVPAALVKCVREAAAYTQPGVCPLGGLRDWACQYVLGVHADYSRRV